MGWYFRIFGRMNIHLPAIWVSLRVLGFWCLCFVSLKSCGIFVFPPKTSCGVWLFHSLAKKHQRRRKRSAWLTTKSSTFSMSVSKLIPCINWHHQLSGCFRCFSNAGNETMFFGDPKIWQVVDQLLDERLRSWGRPTNTIREDFIEYFDDSSDNLYGRASFTTLKWVCFKMWYSSSKIPLNDLNTVWIRIFPDFFSPFNLPYLSVTVRPCSATMVASGSQIGPDATNRSPKPSGAMKSDGRPLGGSKKDVVNKHSWLILITIVSVS